MVAREVIFGWGGLVAVIKCINDNEFDFHTAGNDVFNIYACLLTGINALFHFRKSCKIGCKFHKCPVVLDRADNSCNGFTNFEILCIFLPSAEKFFMSKAYSAVFNGFYNGFYFHADRKSFTGVFYS